MSREEKNARHREYMKTYRASPKGQRLRDYQREYQKQYRAARVEQKRTRERELYQENAPHKRKLLSQRRAEQRQWLASIKLSSGCVDCGFKGHADALHFDHLPQYTKSLNVGLALGRCSRQRVLDEINKCEVRCANCHAIKTATRRKGLQ